MSDQPELVGKRLDESDFPDRLQRNLAKFHDLIERLTPDEPEAEASNRRFHAMTASMEQRDGAVQVAVTTNGYERLQQLVPPEHFAEFHACVCGMAYAIADWAASIDGPTP